MLKFKLAHSIWFYHFIFWCLYLYFSIDFKFKHMCNNLKIYVNPKWKLVSYWKWWCHKLYNQFPSTYGKFVFAQFNKKKSHLIWRKKKKNKIKKNKKNTLWCVINWFCHIIFWFLLILCSKFKCICYNLKIYANLQN